MVVNEMDVLASIRILSDCNWNLQDAVNTAFEIKSNQSAPSSSPYAAAPPSQTSGGLTNRDRKSSEPRAASSEAKSTAAMETELSQDATTGGGGQRWVPSNTILASGLSFIGAVAHRVLPQWASESQNFAPATFIQNLRKRHPDLPNFFQGSYRDACQHARSQNRSLFVYIHCPQHEDTEEFINRTLSAQLVRETLASNFVCWAGSVTQSDTFKLCNKLRVEGYPCVAVLNPHPGPSRVPVPLHEGPFPPQAMVNWLLEVKRKYENQIRQSRQHTNEVKQSSQLREMQDMEYLQALEMDKQRESREREGKQAEARKAVEEAKKKANAEALVRQAELEEKKLEKERLKQRAAIKSEPPAGPGVVLVVIRLPDGQQIKRRFHDSTTFNTLFALIETYELVNPHGESIEKWVIRSRFPNKKWSDASMQIKEAGMGKQAMFFVQEEL